MRILNDVPFEIDAEEVFQRLHLDSQSEYADEINAIIDRARTLARPRSVYDVAFVQERGEESLVIQQADPVGESSGHARFESKVLRANLDEVERVFPFVASCGPELDTLPLEADDVFGQFCLDTIKEMALRGAIVHLVEHLKASYELETIVTMNPGSGDALVWPIEQQRELFDYFGDVEKLIDVVLTDSFLMVPNKSVSGILYASEYGFQSCQLCHRENCPNRRAPFDPHMWEERFGSSS